MKYTALAILAGFLLDQLFGDPYWLPHPIRAIGWHPWEKKQVDFSWWRWF